MLDWIIGFEESYLNFSCVFQKKLSFFQLHFFVNSAILFKENVLGGILP